MATARDIAIRLCVTLIVAAGVSWPAAPAHAGASCNLGDLFNSAVNAVGSFGSSACLGATADDGGAVASYAIAGGLEAVAAANSGAVNDFCNALNTAQDNLNSLQTALNGLNAGVDLASVLGSLDPLSIVECACNIQQGINQFVNELGDCACDLVDWIPGVHCGCTPPPPIQANCAVPTTCFTGSSDPACQGNVILGCLPAQGPFPPICPGQAQPGPGGTFVSMQTGDSNCPQTLYCFCPQPLVPIWTTPPAPSSFDPNPTGVFTCQCPSGTWQPKTKSGQPLTSAGVPVCLCDYTNQPPKVTSDPSQMCNINILGQPCPNGQTRLGQKCVTPCADPTKGMTMDGACCDPTQMSSCGQCCPPNTTPNPVDGSCTPHQIAQ
ncbi:MAG: hypothetical protein ACLP1D_12900 [Xanthobacteraceae bacterium]